MLPMKKQLNTDAIANELRGNSAFFPDYKKNEASDLPANQQTGKLANQQASKPASQQASKPANWFTSNRC